MSKSDFWIGFGAGSAAAVAGFWLSNSVGTGGDSRIVRLEKSVQIGRPVDEVFAAWSDVSKIPERIALIRSVQMSGSHSRWIAEIEGQPVTWEAEVAQNIPGRSIGWKSTSGPRHTGRILFLPLDGDTLVHVQMNYAPAIRALRPFVAPLSGRIEGYIEHALREFKASLEGHTRRGAIPDARGARTQSPEFATGTYGPELSTGAQNPRFDSPDTPVEYTRPTDVSYPGGAERKR
ncbi:MAG TPA: SRPBCC family protein [Candidatus Acidoferrales bacterium]|nr:SRPBCC family protein [Candidatus Acidoferrales bacterium]